MEERRRVSNEDNVAVLIGLDINDHEDEKSNVDETVIQEQDNILYDNNLVSPIIAAKTQEEEDVMMNQMNATTNEIKNCKISNQRSGNEEELKESNEMNESNQIMNLRDSNTCESIVPNEDELNSCSSLPKDLTPVRTSSRLTSTTSEEYDDEVMAVANSHDNAFRYGTPRGYLISESSDDYVMSMSDPLYEGRMKELEEEQEQLNSSLMALTSHFAQVQLRLKQIVDAEPDEREKLLKDLEQFAFRGIPDDRELQIELFGIRRDSNEGVVMINGHDHEENQSRLEIQRVKQKELIEKLKEQLEDLEKYAYETGDYAGIPSCMLLERQSVIIEQLKGRLPLNLDEMDKLSPEELRKQVDQAIRDLVNPVIMKEQLVSQLKTQITDLERFITFLQGSAPESFCHPDGCTCDCPQHGNSQKGITNYDPLEAERSKKTYNKRQKSQKDNEKTAKMIKRALTLLQMFTIAQFGCGGPVGDQFESNTLKKTSKGNHWGDLRARLEMAIDRILDIHSEKCSNDSDYTSDSDDPSGHHPTIINEKMSSVVRKELAPALRDLLQHGLKYGPTSSTYSNAFPTSSDITTHSIFNWGCFSSRSSLASGKSNTIHAWDVLLRYYELKNGPHYNASPARRLSQSFNLQIVGGTAITPKQTLLSCIDDIIETHTSLKRSLDSHFKAFVCAALNENKLVPWLKLVVKSRSIINSVYNQWSYVASTGFDDSLHSLEKLSSIKFHLPCDLAVRQLQNINDAF